MGVYDPPEQPAPTGDPLVDVNVAWGWLADFFNRRTTDVFWACALVNSNISQILKG